MLDYTRTLFNKTVKDVTAAFTVFHFGTQIIYVSYLTYLLFTPNKIWYLHLPLLAISLAFLVYDVISSRSILQIKRERPHRSARRMHKQRLSQAKQKKATVTKIKFYVSHSIKLFVLASALYPIIVAPDTVHPLSIMCTTVMVLLWILLVIFEILKIMLEGRKDLFLEALQADVEFVTKPVNAVKKLFGKEVDEPAEPTKERAYLDGLVHVVREEKAQKKADEKAARKEKLSSWLDRHLPKIPSKKASASPSPTEATEAQDTEAVTAADTTEQV